MSELRYNSYAAFFRRQFGGRLQKVSVDAGFSCPNRSADDRTVGGCTFCNNRAFNPSYCSPEKPVAQQIDEGIEFHRRRYPATTQYLAYFQPYSNTFASLDKLRCLYEEALSHKDVAGIIIGTRPDCVDEEKLDYIATIAQKHYVAIEYGIESCYDSTLVSIHRGHTFAATRRAIEMTAQRNIHCGGHLIFGLPGESRQMILNEAGIVNTLPLDTLKLHQLQILVGSAMASQQLPATHFDLDEYISLVCDFLERLRPDIMLERFAGEVPPRFQAHPEFSWRRPDGRLLRNEEVPPMVNRELQRRGTSQGCRANDAGNHSQTTNPQPTNR